MDAVGGQIVAVLQSHQVCHHCLERLFNTPPSRREQCCLAVGRHLRCVEERARFHYVVPFVDIDSTWSSCILPAPSL
jgi:hypothetical protein